MADQRIVFAGDSYVAGVGDPTALGWVGRLAQASSAADRLFTGYNLGVRRETSVQVAARWTGEAAPRLTGEADCRLVLSFGANDATVEDGGRRVAPDASAAALERCLHDAATLDLPAFVVGPPPVADVAHTARIAELSAAFAEVCRRASTPFAATVDALREDGPWLAEARAGDGAHPAAGGYEQLARVVLASGWLDWLGSRG